MVEFGEDGELAFVGLERGGETEAGGDLFGEVAFGVGLHATSEGLGHFGEAFVVESGEGAERGVGAESAGAAGFAGGRVEGIHGGMRDAALAVGVDGAAVAVGVAFLGGIPWTIAEGFPNAGGDGWPNGSSVEFVGEEIRDGEVVVADVFGGKSVARTVGEEVS